MEADTLNQEDGSMACRQFIEGFSTVLMATVDSYGEPEASYAPYIKYEDDYFVLISELAKHTKNLIETGKASLLFIENESDAKNIFARKRVSYQCDVYRLEKKSDVYNSVMLHFSKKFGKIVELLKTLKDFNLYRLSPKKGRYVAGFGRTFIIKSGGEFEVVKPGEK